MMPRDRVLNALEFREPDVVPLEMNLSGRGLYEHGEKLRSLFKQCVGDFENKNDTPEPEMDPRALDPDGNYHEFKEDAWGTIWENRIFCISGQPVRWPLEDINRLNSYKMPEPVFSKADEFTALQKRADQMKKAYFFKEGWFGLLERMIALRRFEDVLADIAEDTNEINLLADRLTEYNLVSIKKLIEAGVDGIQFGDDYGTQNHLLMSPVLWRHFFKPRIARMIKPVKDAGIKVFFHSCGMVRELLDDFKEIGADAIWPQLQIYHMPDLASHCREIGLAVAIHVDRANVMTHGTPEEVKNAVKSAVDIFRPQSGGSWFYVEIDNGFPYQNIKSLIDSIHAYREGV